MRFDEAKQLAQLLGVTVDDVLRHAGIPVGAGALVPIVGTVDGAGEAHVDWGQDLGRLPAPAEMPPNTVAVVFQTAATPLDPMDGWACFLAPPVDGVPVAAVGRLCLARLAGSGTIVLRFLRRSYMPARFNLIGMGAPSFEGVSLEWATPVQHIRT